MKVLLTKPFLESDLNYIRKRLVNGIEIIIPEDYSAQTLTAKAEDADVLFGGMVTESILKSSKNLRFIQVPWTGVDNLDFELLKKYNTIIANSHSNAIIVAEHAVALMMDASKRISYHDRLMRNGEWNRVSPNNKNELSPFSKLISGSKVAIIGYGAIGKNICHLLKGFSCSFKVFNRSPKTDNSSNIKHFLINDLEAELKDVDFVFLSLPLTQESKDMVNAKFLAAMNENAVLINVSRGEIVEEDSLFEALRYRKIGFAAIDTWYNYPSKETPNTFPSLRNNFHELDNVILSPHRAGYVDSGLLHLDDAIENLNRCKQGQELINIISLNNKY